MKYFLNKINKRYLIFGVAYLIVAFLISFTIWKQGYNDHILDLLGADVGITATEDGVQTEAFGLPAAAYKLMLVYSSPADVELVVVGDGAEVVHEILPAGDYNYYENLHFLNSDTQTYFCRFIGADPDTFYVNNFELMANRSLNNDARCKAFLAGLVSVFIGLFILGLMCGKIDSGKIIPFVTLLLFTIFVSSPCFNSDLLKGHDIWCHLGRIEGVKEAIREGQYAATILPNTFNGYGVLGFVYPQLFLYLPAFLRCLNVSMPLSYHIFILFVNVLTCLVTYYSARSIVRNIDKCGNELWQMGIATITTVSYLAMSYRLEDVFVRAAYGEMLAMAFFPAVIAGAYHVLAGNRKNWWVLVLGLSGILHSHVLSCCMVLLIVLAIFIGFIVNVVKDGRWKEILYSIGAFLLINIWYIVPFIRFYTYGLNTDNLINEYVYKDVAFIGDLFTANPYTTYEDHQYFLKTLGVTGLVILIATLIFVLYQVNNKDRYKDNGYRLLVCLLACFLVALVLSSDLMPLKIMEDKMPNIWSAIEILQFPYRLITIVGAVLTFMLPIVLVRLHECEKFEKLLLPLCALLLGLMIYDSSTLIDGYKDAAPVAAHPYTGDYISHLPGDYLPADTEMNVFDDTTPYIENGTFTAYSKQGTKLSFSYEADSNTTASMPVMYYPCYSVKDENGNKLETYKCDNSRFGIVLPAGTHTVTMYAHYSFFGD